MGSISIPCPKCSMIPRHGAWRRNSQHQQHQLVSVSKPSTHLLAGSSLIPLLQVHHLNKCPILCAQLHEATFETSNSSPVSSTKLENSLSSKEADAAEESIIQDTSAISSFMAEVSDLVKLVDSKDITELHLKQKDCEITIRKREALPQPPPIYTMMQPPPQSAYPAQVPSPPMAAAPPSSAALPPPSKGSKFPPLKCPMAGTFYRCPSPGEPPFVKVGDKVQKGQVVCIIEAMKLMNEIEADQSGTIVEILAEDKKAVSVDLPLLIIEP